MLKYLREEKKKEGRWYIMCTASSLKTNDTYFGRTLDYESSYGEKVVITPRNYPFNFRHSTLNNNHYAIIGIAHVADYHIL